MIWEKRGQTGGAPHHEVEQVSSFSFIGVTITENLDHHTSPSWLKKHRKGFYFLWKLRKAKFQRKIPVIFFQRSSGKHPDWKHRKLP